MYILVQSSFFSPLPESCECVQGALCGSAPRFTSVWGRARVLVLLPDGLLSPGWGGRGTAVSSLHVPTQPLVSSLNLVLWVLTLEFKDL